ncbi:MAG: hypothetical protein KKF44_09590 [Nanoarchaeota archaeon]|nr:hypothetical protein [Nanoarchaeota archaeon]
MSEVKTIKGVDNTSWAEFKSMAAENNKNMGDFFSDLVKFYKERKAKKFWDDILNGEKLLSDKDADKIKILVKEMRSDYGYRDIKWD